MLMDPFRDLTPDAADDEGHAPEYSQCRQQKCVTQEVYESNRFVIRTEHECQQYAPGESQYHDCAPPVLAATRCGAKQIDHTPQDVAQVLEHEQRANESNEQAR